MSVTEKKRSSVLNPSLLQSITQAFSQSTTATISSPSDQLANLSVTTPTTSSSIEIIPDLPQLAATEFVEFLYHLFQIMLFSQNRQKQLSSAEQTSLTPLLTLKHEFQLPTQTPRRSSNFLKGCKW